MLYDLQLKIGIPILIVCGVAYLYLAATTHPEPPQDGWFQATVIDSPRPVLVKFTADWCGPCQALDGELDRLESQSDINLRIVRVNVDQRPELARHYGVSSIPRMLIFKDGQVVGDRVGGLDYDSLVGWVRSEVP
ncbi:MAG: thioredoxin [Planctomycetales bacterium]|nr:thioredoxin [Planctomycetales bacterium]